VEDLALGLRISIVTLKKTVTVKCHDHYARYTVKKVSDFPVPAGMSLTKLSLAGNNLIICLLTAIQVHMIWHING
jgi:hypothetical protein